MILRHEKPARPQPVAIECRANQMPIGERHGRRPIPWLDAVAVICEERRMPPRVPRRHHHPHRLGHRAPVARQQLDHLVEARRIRPAGRENRPQLIRQRRRSGRHACAIAPDGVDFAVVSQNPKRLRAIPRRRNIRRVALMKQCERRDESLVRKVRIELRQQPRRTHRLIDDGRRRQRTDVTLRSAALELFARQIQPAVPLLIGPRRAVRQQDLSDDRQCRRRNLAQNFRAAWEPRASPELKNPVPQ